MDKANSLNDVAGHAREISFAIFRVAALIECQGLRSALESSAVDLARKVVSPRSDILVTIAQLEQIVRLSEAVGEIKPLNSKILLRELSKLRSMVVDSASDDLGLENIFGKEKIEPKAPVNEGGQSIPKNADRIPVAKFKSDIPETPAPPRFSNPVLDIGQAPNRQSVILQFVKGLPNGCRMKDLMERFPSVSERTLRNDLQTLISKGILERFGAVQGPFSYYRVKNNSRSEGIERAPVASAGSTSGGVTKSQIIAL